MPQPGEHADVLRALGRFLDENDAYEFEITNHDIFLAVSWGKADGAGERSYQEHELEKLRQQARLMRQGLGGGNPGGLAELMRTLGQEIDREQIDISRIEQD